MSFDWKGIVKTVAPTLATALGGPLAGNATKAIAELFLGKSDASQEELESAIASATPEQLIKLKELDLQFQQLDSENFKTEISDRVSAREMGKDLNKNNDHTPRNLSYMFLFVYFGLLIKIMWDGVLSDGEKEIMFMLSPFWGVLWQYWFGTSRSSLMKDFHMRRN